MIDLRLDRRLRGADRSLDVVSRGRFLAEAFQHLDAYLEERPVPFYPWLRQFAFNRLLDLHRRHLLAQKRSAKREVPVPDLNDGSVVALTDRFIASVSSPSHRALREEERGQVQAALLALGERDREILMLRYMEMLSTAETASVLGISEGAVKVRLFRALAGIRASFFRPSVEEAP